MAERIITNPGTRLRASVQVPGDKSLSHRALLFAAIAEGDSYISGLGPGDDVHSTIEALDQFGVIVGLHTGECRRNQLTVATQQRR